MSKIIGIITGATGGIGKEFVNELINEDLDEIWTIGRNREKLDLLYNKYGNKIRPISMDLGRTEELRQFEYLLKKESPIIKYLINNASIAKMGNYKDFSMEEIEKTIDLNCKAPVIMSTICIPYMIKGSHIMNISSASAFQPNPYINLYAASKAFERNYSRALNVELTDTGITATAVCPGWVDTELLTKTINGKKVHFPGIVSPKKVVKTAFKDAKKGKDMSVCTLYVKCQHVYVKFMTQKFIMKMWMKGLRRYL